MIKRWTIPFALCACVACLSVVVDQVASQERDDDVQSIIRGLNEVELAQNTAQKGKQQGNEKGAPGGKQRPTPPRTTPTPPSREPTASTRRRRRSSSLTSRRRSMSNVPNMFGDFFGGGSSLLTVAGAFNDVPQIFNDASPLDLLVTHMGSPGFGSNPDPTVQIMIEDRGVVIARSIAPGMDVSGDGQFDTYEIDEPAGSAPQAPPGGKVTFLGGQAIFVNLTSPNTSNTPADGSDEQGDGWNLIFAHRVETQPQVTVFLPPGGGTAVRRQKVSENNSPIPRDRFIFNYHYFNNVIGGIGDVNRYTVGWEATLVGGNSSVEFRFPFAGTLAHEQIAGGVTARDTEFGNVSMIIKHIIWEGADQIWAAGLGINAPTAQHTLVRRPDNTLLVRWRNDAVHLLPYIGAVGTPSDQVFWQGFLQLDLDTGGNRIDADSTGANVAPIGVVQDPNILFADFSIGRWLFDDPNAQFVTGIAPMLELHYATTLQDAETINGNGITVSGLTQRFDVLNLSAAAVIRIADRITVRPGIVVPLRRNHDKRFDYEAGVQLNVY